jgi:hypothetical protein
MVTKVNGAAYPGVWMEKDTAFVRVTFGEQMNAVVTADLLKLDGTAVTGTVTANSTFGVVESAIVQALKWLEQRATIIAVSSYDISSFSFDVMLGSAQGLFSTTAGLIADDVALTGTVQAKVVTATGANVAVGDIVQLNLSNMGGTASFDVQFLAFTGGLPVATGASGTLATGPGSVPGGQAVGTATFTPVTPLTVA